MILPDFMPGCNSNGTSALPAALSQTPVCAEDLPRQRSYKRKLDAA